MAVRKEFLQLLDDAEAEGHLALAVDAMVPFPNSWGYSSSSSYTDTAIQRDALKKNLHWQWICADRYAKFTQTAKYGIYRETSQGVELVDPNSYLYSLVEKPNPQMRKSQLWYLIMMGKMALGNAFVHTPPNAIGKPSQSWFLFPSWGQVTPIMNEYGEITHYEKEHGGIKKRFEYDEIIHFKYPSINSPIFGRSPGMAILETHDLDLMMKRYYNNMMQNGGYPAHYFTSPNEISETRRTEFEKSYAAKAGYAKAGGAFLADNGIEMRTITYSPKDFESNEFLKMNRDQFAQAYAISKSALNISDATNRADADAGVYVTAKFGFQPALDDFGEDWTYGMLKKYDDYVFMKFDSVVSDDEVTQAQVYQTLVNAGIMTPDQVRAMYDWDEHPDGIGDEPIVSKSMTPLRSAIREQQTEQRVSQRREEQ